MSGYVTPDPLEEPLQVPPEAVEICTVRMEPVAIVPIHMLNPGSNGHLNGWCKPCRYFHYIGCCHGDRCGHCHLCPKDEHKRRRRLTRIDGARARALHEPVLPRGCVARRASKTYLPIAAIGAGLTCSAYVFSGPRVAVAFVFVGVFFIFATAAWRTRNTDGNAYAA